MNKTYFKKERMLYDDTGISYCITRLLIDNERFKVMGEETRLSLFFFLLSFRDKNTLLYRIIMRRYLIMVLFTMLICLLLGFLMIVLPVLVASSGAFVLIFGDIIVFGLIIALIVSLFRKKKK